MPCSPQRVIEIMLTCMQFRRNRQLFAGSEDAVKQADLKLVFIPLIFIMLRVWSVIVDPFIYFVDDNTREHFRMSPASAILVLLRVSTLVHVDCYTNLAPA